jgi:hypothetical protein
MLVAAAVEASEKPRFVSGHDFSRAEEGSTIYRALAPEVRSFLPAPEFFRTLSIPSTHRRVPHLSRSLRRVG